MSSPYRESAAPSVNCPRCGKAMPPGDLAACIDDCGAWVTVEAAQLLLEPSELRPSRITSWFRQAATARCAACR